MQMWLDLMATLELCPFICDWTVVVCNVANSELQQSWECLYIVVEYISFAAMHRSFKNKYKVWKHVFIKVKFRASFGHIDTINFSVHY
jgi:hypothetical protein